MFVKYFGWVSLFFCVFLAFVKTLILCTMLYLNKNNCVAGWCDLEERQANSMSIRLKLALLMSSLFIIAIGNAFLSFQLERYSDEKLKWVTHTHKVILATNNLLGALRNAETGQRGYLLTQNASYLEPYHQGVMHTKQFYRQLKHLTRDNIEQQKRLVDIEKLMKLKLDELQQTIQLTENDKKSEALRVVKEDSGKHYMDEVRSLIHEFTSAEKILLEKRRGDYRESRTQLTTLLFMQIMFFIFLAIVTFTFITRNLFMPLKFLLNSTYKMECGKKLSVSDIVINDEMGYLLSRFYTMNEVVHSRTKELNYQANHDALTGLKNRETLFATMSMLINEAQHKQTVLAIVFIDLNKFKPLNDSFGHDAGDLLLKEVAKRLEQTTRKKDEIYRVGGDEFVLLLPDLKDKHQITPIISNIIASFKHSMMISGSTIDISMSIGISLAPIDSSDADELLKMADVAMYNAKQNPDINYSLFNRVMFKRSADGINPIDKLTLQ